MKLLSKEQYEYVVACIHEKEDQYSGGCCTCSAKLSLSTVLSVIHQCTEKPFPKFSVNTESGIFYANEHDGFIQINDEYLFTVNQFKEFTEGCNEVVKWLEGQQ